MKKGRENLTENIKMFGFLCRDLRMCHRKLRNTDCWYCVNVWRNSSSLRSVDLRLIWRVWNRRRFFWYQRHNVIFCLFSGSPSYVEKKSFDYSSSNPDIVSSGMFQITLLRRQIVFAEVQGNRQFCVSIPCR